MIIKRNIKNLIGSNSKLQYKSTKENCEKYKRILVEEGWYKDDKKEIEIKEIIENEGHYHIRTYNLVGKRVLSNEYNRIPLLKMIQYSKQFNVVYQDSKINDYQITDPFINTINIQLSKYFVDCHNLRNDYIKRIYNGESINEQEYLKKLESISYLSYIEVENRKELRNKYLHWSANGYKTGMGPRIKEPEPFTKRRRDNIDG